ncbi:MAG: DNA polymerase IV [bacterium]|nr:DNA polymerase IV [bacterium]
MEQPLTTSLWPRAILHIDADAFFVSCEQALNPSLKGRPVITGKERGIVSAMSYEAKALGVTRAMRLFEAKKICPDLVTLPSDYESYSLFSVRMFEIIRRFSPDIEEYSIDETFVDITGLRALYHCSYMEIAGKIQEAIRKELDISVSIGIATTKVLAKLASKHKKPAGLTAISGREIHHYLDGLPVEKIWGIGPGTTARLNKLGVFTALELVRKESSFIKRQFSKPYIEIWNELRGTSILPVRSGAKRDYKSISKGKTFTPPSTNKEFIFAQFSKNLENACIKARRYGLATTRLTLLLRRQDFSDIGTELKISRPSAFPAELFESLRSGFSHIFEEGMPYRSTTVVLSGLISPGPAQYSLFDNVLRIEKIS